MICTDELYAALFILTGASVIMKRLYLGPFVVLFFSVIRMQTFKIVQFVEMC